MRWFIGGVCTVKGKCQSVSTILCIYSVDRTSNFCLERWEVNVAASWRLDWVGSYPFKSSKILFAVTLSLVAGRNGL